MVSIEAANLVCGNCTVYGSMICFNRREISPVYGSQICFNRREKSPVKLDIFSSSINN